MQEVQQQKNRNHSLTGGFALEPFSNLKQVFKENFDLGLETAGAAYAVYYNDKLVVDLYGGYADYDTKKPFEKDTMAMSALALARLIDQGYAAYEHYVCRYWPEFGLNRKREITILQVLNHQGGLAYGNEEFTVEDVIDPAKMSKKLEHMYPLWTPGIYCGYHTLTYGFLIDQLVRRIDPKKRGVVEYLEEEIFNKYGLKDIYIGLPTDEDNERTAINHGATEEELELERQQNPEALRKYALSDNEYVKRIYENWPWMKIPHYNILANRRLRMPSNMGIGTARSLAQMHYLIIKGRILSKEMLERISQPQLINQMDLVNGYPENKGYGWQHYKNKSGQWIFGHSGNGGQNLRIDIHNGVVCAYLCNGLKAADADDVLPFSRLQKALYQCLEKIPTPN